MPISPVSTSQDQRPIPAASATALKRAVSHTRALVPLPDIALPRLLVAPDVRAY
jgi:hypothetical protein